MLIRRMHCKQGFLHFPIAAEGPLNTIQLWVGGTLLHELSARLSATPGAPYFFLDMRAYGDAEIEIVLPRPQDVSQAALASIVDGPDAQSTNPLYAGLYQEKLRPQFHFSSRRGWLNDPNGLVFDGKLFHLYYQHNPLGCHHGGVNISWGHAVSADLVHWVERSDAILPWCRDYHIASGSATMDTRNAMGLGSDTILAAFTALASIPPQEGREMPSNGQYLAVSKDGGNTYHRVSFQPVIPTEKGEPWRDPRIFLYEDSYCIAVYETMEGRNCVSFYSSQDLYNWTRTAQLPDLYECPDIFPLYCDETGETLWVLYGADGLARLGQFDGKVFRESGDAHALDYGNCSYAGQTWSNHPDGHRVHISWVRGMGQNEEWNGSMGYEEMPFSQCMTVPCRLTLHKTWLGYRVYRRPIDALQELHTGVVEAVKSNTFVPVIGSEYRIELTIPAGVVTLHVGDNRILCDGVAKTLQFADGRSCAWEGDCLKIQAFVDTTTVELFFANGLCATYAMDTAKAVCSVEGTTDFQIQRYALKSIW